MRANVAAVAKAVTTNTNKSLKKTMMNQTINFKQKKCLQDVSLFACVRVFDVHVLDSEDVSSDHFIADFANLIRKISVSSV